VSDPDPAKLEGTERRTDIAGAYGTDLANSFGLTEAPSHVQRTLRRGLVAVSELNLRAPMREPSAPLAFEDSFLVAVQLCSINHDYWENGRALPSKQLIGGMTYLHDLKRDPRALVHDPAHTFHFYMPMVALREVAEQHDIPAISDLRHIPLVGTNDPVMRRLTYAVRAAFDASHSTTGLLLDHILNAACVHVIGRFGNTDVGLRHAPGGLAPWQERRAKEMIDNRMDITLAELARECGVSVSHFTRTFRHSTGMSPHQWLLARRISKARSLIAGTTRTISEIALECGFSSQSHLSAAFSGSLGIAPRKYRQSFAAAKDRDVSKQRPE